MSQISTPTFGLPPELWTCIHRLATSHLSPLATVYAARDVSPEESEAQLSSFLKAVSSLGRVCKLWRDLALEILYENIRISEWSSLSAALDRPELARRVRSISLSPTRDDYSASALRRCPQVEVILRPRFAPSASTLSPEDLKLPPLPALKRLYWTQTSESCTLLQNVVRAAPNLEHLSLSADPKLGALMSRRCHHSVRNSQPSHVHFARCTGRSVGTRHHARGPLPPLTPCHGLHVS
ncbi:hypothetical protein C8R46DRAFT_348021 [Mycena filopes]|nr:hypothetical protein C8R46DRAFT_348021 [Mycena filopes]